MAWVFEDEISSTPSKATVARPTAGNWRFEDEPQQVAPDAPFTFGRLGKQFGRGISVGGASQLRAAEQRRLVISADLQEIADSKSESIPDVRALDSLPGRKKAAAYDLYSKYLDQGMAGDEALNKAFSEVAPSIKTTTTERSMRRHNVSSPVGQFKERMLFQEKTGLTPNAFIAKNGKPEYEKARADVISENLLGEAKTLDDTINKMPGFLPGNSGTTEEVIKSITPSLTAMPLMAMPGAGPVLGAASINATVYGAKYDQYKSEGKDDKTARKAAEISAAIQTPFEFAGNVIEIGAFAKALKPFGNKIVNAATQILKAAASESLIEELPQNYLDAFVDIYADNPNGSESEWISEYKKTFPQISSDAWHGAKIAALGGGGMTLPFAAAGAARGISRDKKLSELKSDVLSKIKEDLQNGVLTQDALAEISPRLQQDFGITQEDLSAIQPDLKDLNGLGEKIGVASQQAEADTTPTVEPGQEGFLNQEAKPFSFPGHTETDLNSLEAEFQAANQDAAERGQRRQGREALQPVLERATERRKKNQAAIDLQEQQRQQAERDSIGVRPATVSSPVDIQQQAKEQSILSQIRNKRKPVQPAYSPTSSDPSLYRQKATPPGQATAPPAPDPAPQVATSRPAGEGAGTSLTPKDVATVPAEGGVKLIDKTGKEVFPGATFPNHAWAVSHLERETGKDSGSKNPKSEPQDDLMVAGEAQAKASNPIPPKEPVKEDSSIIGKKWRSKNGNRQVVGKAEGRPPGWYAVSTDGSRFHQLIHESDIPSEIERDTKNFEYHKKISDKEKLRLEAESESKKERENINGFGDSFTPMQRGRAAKSLNRIMRIDGKEVSLKDKIHELVKDGKADLETTQEDVIKPLSRMAYFRASNEQQMNHDRRVKAAGKKTVYLVGGYDLGKTAYDYAEYLKSNETLLIKPDKTVSNPVNQDNAQFKVGDKVQHGKSHVTIEEMEDGKAIVSMDVGEKIVNISELSPIKEAVKKPKAELPKVAIGRAWDGSGFRTVVAKQELPRDKKGRVKVTFADGSTAKIDPGDLKPIKGDEPKSGGNVRDNVEKPIKPEPPKQEQAKTAREDRANLTKETPTDQSKTTDEYLVDSGNRSAMVDRIDDAIKNIPAPKPIGKNVKIGSRKKLVDVKYDNLDGNRHRVVIELFGNGYGVLSNGDRIDTGLTFKDAKAVAQAYIEGRFEKHGWVKFKTKTGAEYNIIRSDYHLNKFKKMVTVKKPAPKFSKRPTKKQTTPITKRAVERMVRAMTRSWKGAPDIEVHEKQSDLPVEILEAAGENQIIDGVYHEGKVYLVTENLSTRGDAIKVIFHEVVGHHGIDGLVQSDQVIAKRYQEFQEDMLSKLGDEVKSVADQYGYDMTTEEGKSKAFGEFLAREAEKQAPRRFLDRLVRLIRQFIQRATGRYDASRDEIKQWIRDSRKFVEKGGGVGEGAMAFSKDKIADKWFSQMQKVLDDKLPGSGTPNQIKAAINSWANKGLFKSDELEWSGVNEWLDSMDGKVSKQDVLYYLDQNQVVVEEVEKGEDNFDPELARELHELDRLSLSGTALSEEQWARKRELQGLIDTAKKNKETKFSQYQTPGGENYKELLLTLPNIMTEDKIQQKYPLKLIKKINGNIEGLAYAESQVQAEEMSKRFKDAGYDEVLIEKTISLSKANYKSSHWDGPNVLAHVRFNERTGPDGERVLFIEEIQSDWHQEGRKKGYHQEEKLPEGYYTRKTGSGSWVVSRPDGIAVGDSISDTEQGALDEYFKISEKRNLGGVPNAPWKKTWPIKAFQRMVRYAAENGFDSIAWAPGEIQADRYDLSKQVDSVRIARRANDKFDVYVKKDGSTVLSKDKITASEMADTVGKELADKAVNELKSPTDNKEYSGLDLKVGGEGMKAFYDKILPAEVNKFFNKTAWGKVKVGTTSFDIGSEVLGGPNVQKEAWSLPITPEMRQKALREGMPLFSKRPTPNKDESSKKSKKDQKASDRREAVRAKLDELYKETGVVIPEKVGRLVYKYETLTKDLKEARGDIYKKQAALEKHIIKNLPTLDRYRVMRHIKSIASVTTPSARNKKFEAALDAVDAAHAEVEKRSIIKSIDKTFKNKKPRRNARGVQDNRSMDPEGNRLVGMANGYYEKNLEESESELAETFLSLDREGREPTDKELEKIYMAQVFGGVKEKSLVDIKAAEEALQDIVKSGRLRWVDEEIKRKEHMENLRKDAASEFSGGKGAKTQEQEDIERSSRTFVNSIKDSLRSFDDMHQSFEFLLDKFSRFDKDSAPLEGETTGYFADLVHVATHEESRSTAQYQREISDKVKEIFGKKNLLKKIQKNTEIVNATGVFRYTKEGKIEKPLSQNMAYKLWQMFQQPSLAKEMRSQGYTQETLSELERFIDPKVKRWAQWQIDGFFPKYREGVNGVYKKLFYVNMPEIEGYSPIARKYEGQHQDKELLGEGGHYSSVLASATKSRTENSREFKILDGDSVLMKHIVEMEHFKAWGIPMREMRSVLTAENVQTVIKQYHGDSAKRVLKQFLDHFASGGVDRASTLNILDKLRSNFTKSVLGANPVIFLKQLSSIPAYMYGVPTRSFLNGMASFAKNPLKAYTTLMKSEMMKGRYDVGFERDIKLAMQRSTVRRMVGKKGMSDSLMAFIKLGDKMAIIAGGWSVYKHHYDKAIKSGMTKLDASGKALKAFERSTERSQQAGNVKDLSHVQRMGSLGKLFTMFLTSPISYYRNTYSGIRNLKSGRGKAVDNLRRIFVGQFILPMMFQWVSSGFDWEPDKQLRAIMVGPLNGLFIARDAIESFLTSVFEGKVYRSIGVSPPLSTAQTLAMAGGSIHDWIADDDVDEFFDALGDLLDVSGKLTGVPVSTIAKMAKGVKDVYEGETEMPVRRVLGYKEKSD